MSLNIFKNGAGPLLYTTTGVLGRGDNSSGLPSLSPAFRLPCQTTETVLSPEVVEQAVATDGN